MVERSVEHDADVFVIRGANKTLERCHPLCPSGIAVHVAAAVITGAHPWINFEEILHCIGAAWIVGIAGTRIDLATVNGRRMDRLEPKPVHPQTFQVIKVEATPICRSRRTGSIPKIFESAPRNEAAPVLGLYREGI